MREFYRKNRYANLTVTIALLGFSIVQLNACKSKRNSGSKIANSDAFSETRDYLRSALLNSASIEAKPPTDLLELMKDGLIAVAPATTDFTANKTLFSSLGLVGDYGIGTSRSSNGEIIRAETFTFKTKLEPGMLKFAERLVPFQINLSSQAKISIYRKFSDDSEMKSVLPYSLIDLPLNLENARKMRMGDLVVIPVDAQVMNTVDASFFRSATYNVTSLKSLIGDSFVGHAQTGLRANLLVSGAFEMHIFKTSDQLVRVRMLQKSERTSSVGARSSATASAKMTLIPLSQLHQVSELKRLKTINFFGKSSSKLPTNLNQLNNKNVLSNPGLDSSRDTSFENDTKSKSDGLIELANKMAETAEQIQISTSEKINKMVEQVNQDVIRTVNQPIELLKKYSDQEVKFDAQVSWTETTTNRVQLLADYQFNLESVFGQDAFLHAVSGASALVSTQKNGNELFLQAKRLHNFVLAERIARDLWNQKDPPVIRIVSASARSYIDENSFQIRMGKRLSYTLSENWQREQYSLENEVIVGPPLEMFLTYWRFTQGYRFGTVSDKTTTASGLMGGDVTQGDRQPFYWFAREVEGQSASGSGLSERFLTQSYNVLGPVAGSFRLSEQLKEDVEGQFKGRLLLGFSAKALERIFDSTQVSQASLIESVAEVSKSFDNTFGLPYLTFPPGMPTGVFGTSKEAHCSVISQHWGSFYCHYLVDQVYPRLLRAQASRSFVEKSLFLESFFDKGFAANKLGAELLARVILQILLGVRGQLSTDDLIVWWEVRQLGSSAPEHNPSIKFGNPELISLVGGLISPW